MTTPPTEPTPMQTSNIDVKTIATRQKVILVCILFYLLAVAGQFLAPPEVRPILGLAVIGLGIVAAVFIFMLAIELYGTGVGILLAILTLIPLIGLIVLLVVNTKATNALREHGVEVGLLGAK